MFPILSETDPRQQKRVFKIFENDTKKTIQYCEILYGGCLSRLTTVV